MHRARGITVLEVAGMLTIIGVLAAAGWPAYENYRRRAVTSEVPTNLRRLFDGSVAYFHASGCRYDGGVMPRRFPQTVAEAPNHTACQGSEPVKTAPNSAYWTDPTWNVLQFSIDEPSYYQYAYVSAGTEAKAMFTARAHGDLDCNGQLSTFERMGTITADGMVSSGAGLYKKDPSE